MFTPTTVDGRWFIARANRLLLYGALFLLSLLIRLASFTGVSLTDDLWYSRYAQFISEGIFSPDSSHPGLRVGVTVPVGLIYRLFGISEWTTIIVPLMASSLAVPIIVAIGRRIFSLQAAVLAGLLLATFPTHVTYATILVPEPIVELYILIGVLVYLVASSRESTVIAALAGFCFGLAYLAKEIAVFVGGAFVLWSLLRGRWRLACGMAVGMFAIGLLEMGLYYTLTGDPLFRSHAIARSQDLYIADVGGSSPLGWRLFKAYPFLLLLPSREFAFHSLAAIALATVSLFVLPREKVGMLMSWSVIPMLYLNFGSSSFSHYVPVAVAERYVGVVYYPLFLFTGAVLTETLSTPRVLRVVTLLLLSILTLGSIAAAADFDRGSGFSSTEELVARFILFFGAPLLLVFALMGAWMSLRHWPELALGTVVVLLIMAGFVGSLASRNMQTYSDEVAALRAILERSETGPGQIVRFEGDRGWRWRFAVELLAGENLPETECHNDCIVIRPDSSGLPFGTKMPEARPEDPLPIERTFLPYQ